MSDHTDGAVDALGLLGDLQQAVELLARAIGKLTAQLDGEARDDVHPPVLVITTGASALRQALDRQTRGGGA